MPHRKVRITAGAVHVTATLNDSVTAGLVWDALPFEAPAGTWGDEIYFTIPVEADEEQAVEVVEMGAVAYWPPGSALCLFFGLTPMSRDDEIRPASAVNVLGTIDDDSTILKQVNPGETVIVEAI
jgi:uncharacterized protein